MRDGQGDRQGWSRTAAIRQGKRNHSAKGSRKTIHDSG